MFKINYYDKVADDLKALDQPTQKHIFQAINRKLAVEPFTYGKPLRYSFKAYRSLRVVNYRVVFRFFDETTLQVVLIGHRAVVYKRLLNRLSTS